MGVVYAYLALVSKTYGIIFISHRIIDAGGPQAISQLKILTEIMNRINLDANPDQLRRPCDIFDMIGGAGSGGFIAIILVVLGLTADNALEEFIDLTINVLNKEGLDAEDRTSVLKAYTEALLDKYSFTKDTRLLDTRNHSENCKLAVPIAYKHHVGPTYTLRNYQQKALNLTIMEAILATLATPPLFSSTSIVKDAETFEYVGADYALSNPTREIIANAYEAFGPDRHVACILSLGSGYTGITSFPGDNNLDQWNDFLKKLVMDSEQVAQSIDSQMGHLGLYYRLCVSHGLEKWSTTNAAEPGPITAHTSTYLTDVSVSRRVDQCVGSLKSREGISTLEQLSELHSGGQRILPSALPPLTRTFVMRKEPLEFIEKALVGPLMADAPVGPRMLAVTGMGGCGKTQIILKFISMHEKKFASSFFVDGSSKARIRADLMRHVQSLGSAYSQMSFEECLSILSQPLSDRPRLLIYDNVDDPNIEVDSFLPGGSSCLIAIISRNRSIGEMCPEAHLELDVMTIEEGVELLLHTPGRFIHITDQYRKDAGAIAETLGCLPIALAQARSYMYQTRCPPSDYLRRLQSSRNDLLAQPIKYQKGMRYLSTYSAFNASFQMLDSHVQKLLRLLSQFHWKDFPLELIMLAAKDDFSKYRTTYTKHNEEHFVGKAMLEEIFLRDGKWSLTHLDEMTISLQSYSLANLTPGVDTMLVAMHPLVHEWVKMGISEGDKPEYHSAAVLLLALGAREDHTPVVQYLSSHIMHMQSFWKKLHVNTAGLFAEILAAGGYVQLALQLRENVTEELRHMIDPQSVQFSSSLWALASSYRSVGRQKEAEALQIEVLALRKKLKELYGGRHPLTITASENLALTLQGLERLKEAETLETEVLALRKELFGEQHPYTIMAIEYLAQILRDLGQTKEAVALEVEALALRKKVYGERHPNTITVSENLALTLRGLGQLKEAEALQTEVVALRKEIFGAKHRDSIISSNNLADICCKLGMLQRAEALQLEVVKMAQEAPGEDHTDIIMALITLAEIYEQVPRKADALNALNKANTSISATLGSKHPWYPTFQELITRVSNLENVVTTTAVTPVVSLPTTIANDINSSRRAET
ncbi:hypothetical protein M408DRAFT_72598 [Serendipita vermifera MAFF 305830]|uniref:PNPLA domain-containing protein n=1 Tax=Serendipita vermifera MAFF 305830 TaxID=933852 RepID=A0A0C3B386_SERVB|nr:hypothetical protein M408DRAFT_72598 [Serendipita vermifera MAFF 305830]